jgi:hypothetical protein
MEVSESGEVWSSCASHGSAAQTIGLALQHGGKHQRITSEGPAMSEGGPMGTNASIRDRNHLVESESQALGEAPTLGQRAAVAVGAVFLLVGVIGFVPGLTTDATDIHGAGHESPALIFGLFAVSVLHNVVHIAFGVAGLVAARSLRWSALYLAVGGMIYLALAAYGAIIGEDDAANFLPVNTADDFLHLGLGLAMVALGALAGRELDERRGRGPTRASTTR